MAVGQEAVGFHQSQSKKTLGRPLKPSHYETRPKAVALKTAQNLLESAQNLDMATASQQ